MNLTASYWTGCLDARMYGLVEWRITHDVPVDRSYLDSLIANGQYHIARFWVNVHDDGRRYVSAILMGSDAEYPSVPIRIVVTKGES